MGIYSVATSVAGDLPRVQSLEAIARAGFTFVELDSDAGHLDNWTADPAGMRRDLASFGLAARSMHLPTTAWDVAHPDPAARRAALEAARIAFQQAAEVGAGVMICHPNASTHQYTEATFAAETARSRESVAEMARYAAATGVNMALENLPARHLPRPGTTIAHVLAMIDGLGEHVGICLDAGHANANGRNAAAEAREAGARLIALHIQDNDGLGEDQHWLPGRGTTDWGALLVALDEIGFQGPRTFEINSAGPLEDTLAALRTLREEWRRYDG